MRGNKDHSDFANIVKKKAWQNNVRATTRGLKPGRVLVDNKWIVFATDSEYDKAPSDCHFLALVRDYGDHQKVRIFNKQGKQVRGIFYRQGRRGQPIG